MLSIVSMSLENRFMIRPTGYIQLSVGRRISADLTVPTVVSKKDMGLCMTPLMAPSQEVRRKKDKDKEKPT
jgi:hypothetical protein